MFFVQKIRRQYLRPYLRQCFSHDYETLYESNEMFAINFLNDLMKFASTWRICIYVPAIFPSILKEENMKQP
jgi:hypothetical protein